MLRKSTASNAWAAIFKNADFSYKSYKIGKLLAFFLISNSFLSSLLMVAPSSVSVKPN